MANNRSVSVIGCGWVGWPLAVQLLKKGYKVKGSTTTAAKLPLLQNDGVEAFLLSFNPEAEASAEAINALFTTDVLVVTIPPKMQLNDTAFYLKQLTALVAAAKGRTQEVIFLSTTSVYEDLNKEVVEEDASQASYLAAEQTIQTAFPTAATCLRLGGLMGYDRYPAKYFAGKRGLTTGNVPVNYLHRDDVVAIITALIEKGNTGEIYNAVSPEHPSRKAVYEHNCQLLGFPLPEFVEPSEPHPFKLVNSDKLQALPYEFIFPNPLNYTYQQP